LDEDDYNVLVDYLADEDETELNAETFPIACKKFLYEEYVMEYNQQFVQAIILSEEQFNIVKKYGESS
jgi:hypothetical protein